MPTKGERMSKEQRRKISIALMGHRHSKETKRKIGEGGKGKQITIEGRKRISKAMKERVVSKETRRRMSLAQMGNIHGKAHKGRSVSKETRRRISESKNGKTNGRKGCKHTEESKKKMSKSHKRNPSIEKHSNSTRIKMSIAKGGDGDIKRLGDKTSYRMQDAEWAYKILKRDNHTCRLCHECYSRLNAHHIKQKARYPQLRFQTNNGITLCEDCHDKTKGKEWTWEWIFQAILN